jgi:putative tryptophan/tyrosine transport system substrate-binding protein
MRAWLLAALVMLAALSPAIAQTPPTIARVAYLTGGALSERAAWLDALRDALRDHGYREGENLLLETRGAGGRFDMLPELARELLAWRPHVLLTSTTPAALAAKRATTTVPIVVLAVGDPIGVGLVSNLARPTENVTGLSNATGELPGKRLQLLKELMPSLNRAAVIVNPNDQNAAGQIERTQAAARELGITLDPMVSLRSAADLEVGFARIIESGAPAALRLVDPLTSALRRDTIQLASRHRVPVMFAFREDVEAGGLMAYGAVQQEQYRRAAYFVHRLLTGASPGDLPVELPTRFELLINLRTARGLGLLVPPSLLARADEVIE